VLLLLFFSDCRIYLFSSLAARVFNKLTYSLYNKRRLKHNILCGKKTHWIEEGNGKTEE